MDDVTALLQMLALIFTLKFRPMIMGSISGWLMFAGMMARPLATSLRIRQRFAQTRSVNSGESWRSSVPARHPAWIVAGPPWRPLPPA
jgi:hypothetical protein